MMDYTERLVALAPKIFGFTVRLLELIALAVFFGAAAALSDNIIVDFIAYISLLLPSGHVGTVGFVLGERLGKKRARKYWRDAQ